MTGIGRWIGAAGLATAMVGGLNGTAHAVERFSVVVKNERDFTLSIEIQDNVCGSNVVLRDRLESGESREIEICANPKGVGALGAIYGSGCSQVKRTKFLGVQPGDEIGF
ncbi:MAG: hypothetical protein ACR2PS_13530 [Pseudomonadales bacterium]